MTRAVDIVLTAQLAAGLNFRRKTAVVIDVLRATTSILTLLERGAQRIYPVADLGEARGLHRSLPEALLCGERGGVPPRGFDLGNSPAAFSRLELGGRQIVFTTTNGTQAIRGAAGAGTVLLACLRNASAAAEAAALGQGPVLLVCSGTEGRFSSEDFYAAGLIAGSLAARGYLLSDLAWTAALLARIPLEEAVNARTCAHLRFLIDTGFEEDVRFCLCGEVSRLVPRYHPAEAGGYIGRLESG